MKNRKGLLRLIPLFLILLSATVSYSSEIDDINAAIKTKGAKWVAKENPISLLSLEEKRMRVRAFEGGAIPDRVTYELFNAPTLTPPSYDWRNVSGSNYVTPVRNQGNCGSCWAFAVTAALESKALITYDTPGTDLNLSEQIVVSCSGAGSCSGGAPSTASNFFVNKGTNLESCYPYTATNGDCNSACSNWQNGAYRIDNWNYVSSGTAATESTIKNAIYMNGPVIAVFDVYDDFFSYHSGVYSYASGNYAGGHAVLIVGWDDGASAFIVKNSWGEGWGEAGYFRIAYSELTGTTNFASWTYAYGNVYQAIVEFVPPETVITSGPSGTITTSSATFTFTFTGSDNVTPVTNLVYTTYLQGYDSGWSGFSSSTAKSYNNLPPGSYTFQVKAKDLAGNEDPAPATRSFIVRYTTGSVSYKINPNASYSYVNGTNKTTSWQGNANDGYFDLALGDFDFKFYAVSVKEVRVSTNGYITFGMSGSKNVNDPFPSVDSPNAVIAPFWDDLDLTGLGSTRGFRWAFTGNAPNRQLVLEWRQVPSHEYLSETYSFEIILYESTDRIKFQYLDVDSATSHDKGVSATVGIEDFNGTVGQQFSYNSSSLSNGLAIEFIPAKRHEIVDFDEDGKTDIAVYRAKTGAWYVYPSGGGAPFGVGWGGGASDIPVPGDYDGDGKTDVAIYRASNGGWYIIPSSAPGTPYGVGWGGGSSDKPLPGDYDGDGKTDVAIYRASNGGWYIIPSSAPSAPYGAGWGGGVSDIPVPGDYDGDGKTDVAIYRASNGGWYIIPSSTPSTPYGVGWGGGASDIPVPGDYDGDGKTDVAIHRASNGGWYIIPSSTPSAPYGVGWGGGPSDKPVPGDYDGDGRTDIAVYQASTGAWYIYPSGSGSPYGVGWGGDVSDIPLTTNPD